MRSESAQFISMMRPKFRLLGLVLTLGFMLLLSGDVRALAVDSSQGGVYAIVGRLIDPQGQPVVEAEVKAISVNAAEPHERSND